MKFFFLIILFIFNFACKKSIMDDVHESAHEERRLSVAITVPAADFYTSSDTVLIKGTAYDAKAIKKVELSVNVSGYTSVTQVVDWMEWEKTISLTSDINTVCARVTNSLDGERNYCIKIYKTLAHISDYPGSLTSIKSVICTDDESKIFCIGGYASNNILIKKMSIYDIANTTWNTVDIKVGATEEYRESFAAAYTSGKVYVLGGVKDDDYVTQYLSYEIASSTWAYIPKTTNDRVYPASVALNNKIYLMGGSYIDSNNEVVYLNTASIFDPALGTWQSISSMPTARAGAIAVTYNNQIYVIGGFSNTVSGSIEKYDPVTDAWTELNSLSEPRVQGWAGIAGENIYIGGGHNIYQRITGIEKLDINTGIVSKAGEISYPVSEAGFTDINGIIYLFGGVGKKAIQTKKIYQLKPVY